MVVDTSTLSNAGSVAAIVAGALVLATTVWGVGRWAWRVHRAADVELGLSKVGASGLIFPSEVRLGIKLANGLERPLGYLVEKFTVEIDGQSHPLSAPQLAQSVGPSQPEQWVGPGCL